MLTTWRFLIAVLASGVFLLPSVTLLAHAGPKCYVDPVSGLCLLPDGTVVSAEPTEDSGGKSERASGLPRTCTFGGRNVLCESAIGSWSSYASAWCRAAPVQPELSDPIWSGHSGGRVYECVRPGFDGVPDPNLVALWWLPSPPEAPDPEELARRLVASIGFQAPELGIFPRGDTKRTMGVVGWNAWLWAAPSSVLQWGPVADSISEGGVTVSLTASVVRMRWEMGNGDVVVCGGGTRWSLAGTRGGRNVASPTCGYVYEADGVYTVTGTSEWEVDWSGGGRSGTLPLSLSREVEVIVGELQSVNVPS